MDASFLRIAFCIPATSSSAIATCSSDLISEIRLPSIVPDASRKTMPAFRFIAGASVSAFMYLACCCFALIAPDSPRYDSIACLIGTRTSSLFVVNGYPSFSAFTLGLIFTDILFGRDTESLKLSGISNCKIPLLRIGIE